MSNNIKKERKQTKCIHQSLIWPLLGMHCCCCSGCSEDLDDDPDPIVIKRLKIQVLIIACIFGYLLTNSIKNLFI